MRSVAQGRTTDGWITTVHVENKDGNPISGKRVTCQFPGSFMGIAGTHSEEYTDEDGIAEFDEVPVGTAEVYVNGELQIKVGVGESEHEDVTVTL